MYVDSLSHAQHEDDVMIDMVLCVLVTDILLQFRYIVS